MPGRNGKGPPKMTGWGPRPRDGRGRGMGRLARNNTVGSGRSNGAGLGFCQVPRLKSRKRR